MEIVPKAGLFLLQMDPEIATDVDRIAVALTIIAVVAVVVGLVLVVVLIANFALLRSIAKMVKGTDSQLQRLSPKLEPLIDRMTRLTSDTQEITETVRRGVRDVMSTIEDVNESLRDVSLAAERRVREFGAVLDIVKEETEQALMDTAATARGVSVAAGTWRGDGRRRMAPRVTPPTASRAAQPSPPPDLPAEVQRPTPRLEDEEPSEPVAPVVSGASGAP
jgi:uncharacterized protein YoxC